MNILARVIGWLYTQSINLYPVDFRATFGDEMQDVFTQAMIESTDDGRTLLIFWRELKDFPASLLRQHWATIKQEKVSMTTISSTNDMQPQTADRQPGSWGAAFLAGLPHLLMGLLIGMGKLADLDVYQFSASTSAIIGIVLACLVIGMLGYAWRHGWPLWSASWYLYGTWVSVALIGLSIESLDLEDSWRYTNALLIGWILVCIAGYFALLLKSKTHALLAIAFLFPLLGVMTLEFIPNPIEGWLAIGLGLLAAVAAGVIIRIGQFQTALGLVLGVNVVAGFSLAYVGEYQIKDLPLGLPAHAPRFGNFLELLVVYNLLGLGIVALPFILRGLWHLGRRKLAS